MKSFTRACLIFSGTVIAIGLVLTIIGGCLGAGSAFAKMVTNGDFSFSWRDNHTVINSEELNNRYEEYTDVDKLDINLKYGELIIEKVEGNRNIYIVEADNVVDGFICNNNDGELVIKDKIRNRISIGFEDNIHQTITVYVPENAHFDNVNIEMGAGHVNVGDINTKELGIDLGAGQFEGNKINAEKSKVSVGAGHLIIDEFVTDTLDMECGTGKMEVKGNIIGDADVECGIGNIVLFVLNKEQSYNFHIDCGIGNVTVGEQSFSGIACKKTIDNNASNTMDIECGVGSIEVYFDESI